MSLSVETGALHLKPGRKTCVALSWVTLEEPLGPQTGSLFLLFFVRIISKRSSWLQVNAAYCPAA